MTYGMGLVEGPYCYTSARVEPVGREPHSDKHLSVGQNTREGLDNPQQTGDSQAIPRHFAVAAGAAAVRAISTEGLHKHYGYLEVLKGSTSAPRDCREPQAASLTSACAMQ